MQNGDRFSRLQRQGSAPGSCVAWIEKHAKMARVSVIDHGQGISKERQAGLFTRFSTEFYLM